MAERIFNHERDCREDVTRLFPPIVGRGRGQIMTAESIAEAREMAALRARACFDDAEHPSSVVSSSPRDRGASDNGEATRS